MKRERSLHELLEQAKRKPMSSAQREAQLISFAYGNAGIENDAVTKQMVTDCAARLRRGA